MKKIVQASVVVFITLLFFAISGKIAAAQSEFSRKVSMLADKLTSSVSGKVIDVRNNVVYIYLGERDSIFEGAVFEVIRQGDPLIMDGKTYYEEEPVGRIQVTKVRRDLSMANAVAALKTIQKGDLVFQQKRISPRGRSGGVPAKQGLVGLSGVDLESVHRRLENGGFNPGPFDERDMAPMSEAIKRFQKFANLNVTGELDEVTWSKLKILYDPQASASRKTVPAYDASADDSSVMKVNKIALMEFVHGKRYNDFTKNIYETLSVYFIQKGFQVVERSQLDKILEEQKIAYSGLVDISTAQKLGKLLGSEVALLGTVSEMGNDAVIRARMVDVEKGVSMTAAQVEIQKTPEIMKLMGENSRDGAGGVIIPVSTGKTKPTPEGFPMVQKMKGYTFELLNCEVSGKDLVIRLRVTSNEYDRKFTIYNHYHDNKPKTRIFVDYQGWEYWPDYIVLAGKRVSGNERPGYVNSMLIADAPATASLHFSNIALEAKAITRFDLGCWTSDGDARFPIYFRNFPINRTK